jgi:hypothetical protein
MRPTRVERIFNCNTTSRILTRSVKVKFQRQTKLLESQILTRSRWGKPWVRYRDQKFRSRCRLLSTSFRSRVWRKERKTSKLLNRSKSRDNSKMTISLSISSMMQSMPKSISRCKTCCSLSIGPTPRSSSTRVIWQTLTLKTKSQK